jgi:U3 small nucleolar RNA-associated protein 10
MVSSLKEKHTSREDLLMASKDFLRIFTDAPNHVPRHRRTQYVFVISCLAFLYI